MAADFQLPPGYDNREAFIEAVRLADIAVRQLPIDNHEAERLQRKQRIRNEYQRIAGLPERPPATPQTTMYLPPGVEPMMPVPAGFIVVHVGAAPEAPVEPVLDELSERINRLYREATEQLIPQIVFGNREIPREELLRRIQAGEFINDHIELIEQNAPQIFQDETTRRIVVDAMKTVMRGDPAVLLNKEQRNAAFLREYQRLKDAAKESEPEHMPFDNTDVYLEALNRTVAILSGREFANHAEESRETEKEVIRQYRKIMAERGLLPGVPAPPPFIEIPLDDQSPTGEVKVATEEDKARIRAEAEEYAKGLKTKKRRPSRIEAERKEQAAIEYQKRLTEQFPPTGVATSKIIMYDVPDAYHTNTSLTQEQKDQNLLIATSRGDGRRAIKLIEDGANVQIGDKKTGKLLITIAIEYRLNDLVELILRSINKKALNKSFSYSGGKTKNVLWLALGTGYENRIVGAGADLNEIYEEGSTIFSSGKSTLAFDKMVIEQSNNLDQLFVDGVKGVKPESLAEVVKKKAPNLDYTDKRGHNAAYYLGIERKNVIPHLVRDIIKIFLDLGADAKTYPELAIAAAYIFYRHTDQLISMIKAGVDPNIKNTQGKSLFEIATSNNNLLGIDTLKLFLEKGLDVNTPVSPNTLTPLFNALYSKNKEVVQQVYDKTTNFTSLFDLSNGKGEELLTYLAYTMAVFKSDVPRCIEFLKILISKPEAREVFKDLRCFMNDDELPPIIVAAASFVRGGLPVVDLLIEIGYDVKATSKKGISLFEHTIMHASRPYDMDFLLGIMDRADVNQYRKATPILMVVILIREKYITEEQSIQIVRKFIERGGNINDIKETRKSILMLAAEEDLLKLAQFLLENGADLQLENEDKKTAYDFAKSDRMKQLLMTVENLDTGETWKGHSKPDIEFYNALFDNPSNISLCPICLAYVERTEACMYMNHECDRSRRHNGLYNMYKNKEDKIEWCTYCGRVTDHHKHYELSFPNVKAEITKYVAKTTAELFDKDCVNQGGGGHKEKIKRFDALIREACELQKEVDKITSKRARYELIEAAWSGPSRPDRKIQGILERKNFDIPCEFPVAAAEVTRPDTDYPDILRPTDEAELKPIKHEAPDNTCIVEVGPHEDNRPVYQFQHKQPDGTIWRHENEYYCVEDLEMVIRSNPIDGKCYLNPVNCRGKLYPEELKGIVSDEFYENYRKFFNRAQQPVRGGQFGTRIFYPVDLDKAQCIPPQKKAGRNKTYRKKYRRGHTKKIGKKV